MTQILFLQTLSRFCCSKMVNECFRFEWNIKSLLHIPFATTNEKYAILVLNTQIKNSKFFLPFWKKASLRVAIDGGGNQIYDTLNKFGLHDNDEFWPHVVSGDFDSIRNDVLTIFRSRNVKIVSTPDQNETDFYKGLILTASLTEAKIIMVMNENEGRFDHILANVNTLFKAVKNNSTKHQKIFMLSNETLTWLLKPGTHVLEIPSELWTEKSHCALLPIGEPCRHVSTTGLKWNLNDSTLQFGNLVSSSNTYDINCTNCVVTIKTDNNLIWSMGIN